MKVARKKSRRQNAVDPTAVDAGVDAGSVLRAQDAQKNQARSMRDASFQAVAEALALARSEAERKARLKNFEPGVRETELLLRGAPVWTLRVHRRLGRVGGAAVFFLLMLLLWPALAALVVTGLQWIGVAFLPSLADGVLSSTGLSPKSALISLDVFTFSWLLPVLFFALIGALLAAKLVAVWSRWCYTRSKSWALGLFLGYDTAPWSEFRERLSALGQWRSRRRQDKNRRDAAIAKAQREGGGL